MKYDIAVIGGGVIGCLIVRALSRYDKSVILLERESDVAMGTSKANSAIVHAGYDAKHGSLKALLNVRGNEMMGRVADELSIPFKRIGSFVLAFTDEELNTVEELYENGKLNGVPDMRILGREEVLALEPNLSPEVKGALFAPSAGIVSPYELTVGAIENAVLNGVTLLLEAEVTGIEREKEIYHLTTAAGEIEAEYIINAAGLHADDIAALCGDDGFDITPRKGEYMILDKNQGKLVGHVIFQTPNAMGKGILVTPTVDGNLLVGPNAQNILDKEDFSTTSPGLVEIGQGAKRSVPSVPLREVITSFAGLRAVDSTGDFIIEPSKKVEGLFQVAGIESPGLSAAPAIAEYVVEMLKKSGVPLTEKTDYNPRREPVLRFAEMTDEQKAEAIRKDPRYGHIICRCEKVTEGEICDCIARPAGAKNLDAVKRRTRTGMGRCQGGFCTPRVLGIIARELQIPEQQVTKKGKGSELLVGRVLKGDLQ